MKAYSLDRHQKTFKTYENEPISQRHLGEQFRVAPSVITKLLKQYRDTGDLAPKNRPIRPRFAPCDSCRVASMGKVMCEKRCRHFISLWEKTNCTTVPELGQFYYKKNAAEERRMQELDRERQTTFEDLVQAPVLS